MAIFDIGVIGVLSRILYSLASAKHRNEVMKAIVRSTELKAFESLENAKMLLEINYLLNKLISSL